MNVANQRRPTSEAQVFKTESERLFAEYLDGNGFAGLWEKIPDAPGSPKHPDFLVQLGSVRFLFEVKQREGLWSTPNTIESMPSFVCFDPTKGITGKIQEARPQFRNYHADTCSLVLFKYGDLDTPLHYTHVFEAMLGKLALTWQNDAQTGDFLPQSECLVFDSIEAPGEMIDPQERWKFQNEMISTIIVLERTSLIDHAAEQKANEARERAMGGRSDDAAIYSGALAKIRSYCTDDPPQHLPVVRCVVCENPVAKNPLPRDMFAGPFDERWAMEDGVLKQIHVGDKVRDLHETINHSRVTAATIEASKLYRELWTEAVNGMGRRS